MTALKAQITHSDGTVYDAEVATINSTRMGWEDHGCFQAELCITYGSGGSGTNIAGMILDDVPQRREIGAERTPTLFGMAMIQALIRTLAGSYGKWEDLPGRHFFALFETAEPHSPRHGYLCKGVATIDGTRVLIFEDVAKEWGIKAD